MKARSSSRKTVRLMAALLLILVLLRIASAAAIENLYAVVVYPRQQLYMREFLTFQPFSGKLFQIDPSVGLSYVSYHIRNPQSYFKADIEEIEITDPTTVAQLIDLLNDFHYKHWVYREPRYRCTGGSGKDAIVLTLQSGKRVQPYSSIVIENNCLMFGDTWYYGDPAYFEGLCSLLTG